jgi:hypothetical protein
VTAQEIYEREGFLVFSAVCEYRIGSVVESEREGSILPVGTKLVIVGELTEDEARRANKPLRLIEAGKYYKVIAE